MRLLSSFGLFMAKDNDHDYDEVVSRSCYKYWKLKWLLFIQVTD